MKSSIPEPLIVTGVLLATALIWLASGEFFVASTVGLSLLAARQLWIARSLARSLTQKHRLEPPFPGGPWREIYSTVRNLQLRSRKRKRRLNRFVSRFQEATAALPDAVVIVGRENRIEWCNPAADRLLRLDPRESIGSIVDERIQEPVFVEYIRAGDFARPLEMPAPGDRSIMLSVLVTPFGRRRQRVLVARDITGRYHLDQARKDFIANVSHELRTPLTVLSGHLELLNEAGTQDAVIVNAVETMRSSVDRMGVLVKDLLTLSRLEMGRLDAAETPIDVAALLSSVVRDAQVMAHATQHVLTLEADAGIQVYGSESALRSAFANLVNNAVRHTPPHSVVDISWRAQDDGACFTVTDNGPGIPARHLPRLTERFYRVDASRSQDTGGTGLGLAIVKHALEQHDASLSVHSREGAGTTFECRFPASRIVTGRKSMRDERARATAPPSEVK